MSLYLGALRHALRHVLSAGLRWAACPGLPAPPCWAARCGSRGAGASGCPSAAGGALTAILSGAIWPQAAAPQEGVKRRLLFLPNRVHCCRQALDLSNEGDGRMQTLTQRRSVPVDAAAKTAAIFARRR
ncbi:MAG: hypothetical protein ACLTG0_09285 [Oscillibacter sp.]